MKYFKIENLIKAYQYSFFKNNIYWARYWKSIVVNLVASFSVVMLIVDVFEHILKVSQLDNLCIILGALIIAFIFSLLHNIPRYIYSVRIVGRNDSYIDLIIGDIMREKGDLIIPTNTTFDVTFIPEGFISHNSIQGQMCDSEYYSGDTGKLTQDLENALKKCRFETLENRPRGNKKKYKLETIAKIQHDNNVTSYWIPLGDLNSDGNFIYNSLDIKLSINNIWKYFKGDNANIRELCIPALGTGLTPLNIPKVFIIEHIIDSYIVQSRDRKIAQRLKIILYPENRKSNIYADFDYLCEYLKIRSNNPDSIDKI